MIKALPSSIWSSLKTEMIFCFYCVFFQILPQQSGHAPKINKWKSPHAAQHQHHTPAAKMFSLSLCPESKCDVPIAQSWFFCTGAAEVVVLCGTSELVAPMSAGGSGSALGEERSPLEEERGVRPGKLLCLQPSQLPKEMPDLAAPGSNVELCGSLISYSTLIYWLFLKM